LAQIWKCSTQVDPPISAEGLFGVYAMLCQRSDEFEVNDDSETARQHRRAITAIVSLSFAATRRSHDCMHLDSAVADTIFRNILPHPARILTGPPRRLSRSKRIQKEFWTYASEFLCKFDKYLRINGQAIIDPFSHQPGRDASVAHVRPTPSWQRRTTEELRIFYQRREAGRQRYIKNVAKRKVLLRESADERKQKKEECRLAREGREEDALGDAAALFND